MSLFFIMKSWIRLRDISKRLVYRDIPIELYYISVDQANSELFVLFKKNQTITLLVFHIYSITFFF